MAKRAKKVEGEPKILLENESFRFTGKEHESGGSLYRLYRLERRTIDVFGVQGWADVDMEGEAFGLSNGFLGRCGGAALEVRNDKENTYGAT